jgi:hypothetical protein
MRLSREIFIILTGCLFAPIWALRAPSLIRALDGRSVRGRTELSQERADEAARACLVVAALRTCRSAVIGETQFVYRPSLARVQSPKTTAPSLFAFTAWAEPDGSHQIEFLDVIGVDSKNKAVSVLDSPITLSEQSQHSFWSNAKISVWPILATADYIMSPGETHLGHHRYRIRTYLYGATKRAYQMADEYETEERYPGLDDGSKLSVLERERSMMERHLVASHVAIMDARTALERSGL